MNKEKLQELIDRDGYGLLTIKDSDKFYLDQMDEAETLTQHLNHVLISLKAEVKLLKDANVPWKSIESYLTKRFQILCPTLKFTGFM